MARHNYTPEQIDWLRDQRQRLTIEQMIEPFNTTFSASVTLDSLKQFCFRRKIRSGLASRFEKGNTPWNLGKNVGRMSPATEFKKGQLPPNTRPMHDERLSKDGIIEVKIGHQKWRSKHAIIWEQHHGKPVPAGHVIMFADNDRNNFDIANLQCLTRAEMARLNKQKYSQQHPEIKPALLAVTRIEEKTRILAAK